MKVCKIFIILISSFFLLLTGCNSREIPVTKNEQLLSGITLDNAAVITEAVVDMFDRPDVLGNRLTQVLYNQVVKVIKEEGSWTNITLLDGSTGWVKSKYVSRNIDCVTDGSINNKIVVTAKIADIYTGANNVVNYKKVVLGTELYSTGKNKTGYDVLLPGNKKGWIEEGGVIAIPIEDKIVPKTSSDEFIQTVKKFKGTIYIVGGLSRWGMDSSGLVYICSKINGVEVPRDIEKMSKTGTEVTFEQLQPGDLIFFSTDSLKEDINDVGIYSGENKFFHSSTTKGVIEETLEDTYFKDRIYTIRRIF